VSSTRARSAFFVTILSIYIPLPPRDRHVRGGEAILGRHTDSNGSYAFESVEEGVYLVNPIYCCVGLQLLQGRRPELIASWTVPK
jgi:hypothetical protein